MTELKILHFSWYALAAALVVAVLMAWYLYRPSSGFAPRLSKILAGVRGLMAGILVLLLFDPVLQWVRRTFQQPVVLILQDNSRSMKAYQEGSGQDLFNALDGLRTELQKDHKVLSYHLDPDSTGPLSTGLTRHHVASRTNYAEALKELRLTHWGERVGLVILAGDGQVTHGGDPRLSGYLPQAPIATLASPDTVQHPQWSLSDIRLPQEVEPHKDFPLEFFLQVQGLNYLNGKVEIEDQTGRSLLRSGIGSRVPVPRQRFMLRLSDTGSQMIRIRVSPENALGKLPVMERRLGIEVRPIKNKVLILGRAAHPDAGLVRQVVESRAGMRSKIVWLRKGNLNSEIAGQIKSFAPDLLVLHDLEPASVYSAVPELRSRKVASILIMGPELIRRPGTVLHGPSGLPLVQWSGNLNRVHEVRAKLQAQNSYVPMDSSWVVHFSGMPPLATPFQVPLPQGSWTPLFWQNIQGINTQRPLVWINHGTPIAVAVIAGSGIWQWPLNEARERDHSGTEGPSRQFLGRLVQAMLEGSQRKLLSVKPVSSSFIEDQRIGLATQVFSRSGELMQDKPVMIWVHKGRDTLWQGTIHSPGGDPVREIPGLPEGHYQFLAQADLGDTLVRDRGGLVVEPFDPETWFKGVHESFMQGLAQHSGGRFFFTDQTGELLSWAREILNSEHRILEHKNREPLRKNWLLLGLLAVLAALEWGLRRYWGII